MIFLNILIVLDLRMKNINRRHQLVFSALLLYFLIELSQTKLSSYLVIVGGIGLLGLMFIRSERRTGIELVLISLLSFAVVAWQTSRTNPLMPGNDFLIGAPLLGYANHIASMFHVPISGINPVSHGLVFHWQSLFIIPFFVFHFLRLALVDPKILSAIVIIIVLRKSVWQRSREIVLLLLSLIPLGFLLPVLYSPAWYPLALSFYAPLMSVQAAMLLIIVGFGVISQQKITRPGRVGLGLIGAICMIGIALQGHTVMKADASKSSVVPSTFVQAMEYLRAKTNDTDIIATRRFDLDTAGDESYYWYSALSGRGVVSEGAKYGSLLGAVADSNAEKGLHPILRAASLLRIRRKFLDTIFNSRDSEHVNTSLEALGISYVLKDSSGHEVISRAAVPRRVNTSGYWWLHSR